jgi:hypothetical protein
MPNHETSEALFMIVTLWGCGWLLAVLWRDFGGVIIPLFMSGIGSIVLALMVLIDIRNTWKPLLFLFVGYMLASCVASMEGTTY